MNLSNLQLLGLAFIVGLLMYWVARTRAIALRNTQTLHSMPQYHGSYAFLWIFLPVLLFIFAYLPFMNVTLKNAMNGLMLDAGINNEGMQALAANAVGNYLSGATNSIADKFKPIAEQYEAVKSNLSTYRTVIAVIIMILGALWALTRLKADYRARNQVEKYVRWVMIACAGLAILTTFGIILSVLFESVRFFGKVSPMDFFFNTHWSPQTAMREGQVGGSGSFGVIPLLVGTLLISVIALIVAVPIGLLSAVYLSEYASNTVRAWAKPMLEILAGIPTVVYGFFAALTVAPLIRSLGETIGLGVASESALAAGLVMGIMIIPFISSLSDDVINAVPQSLREGSYGLGATRSETIKKVLLPAALPGIVSAVILAASRAIGETMIVVMAAGLSANLTINPFEAVTTVTVQIVTLLTGDQEFDSAKTLSAFALGLTLFIITFLLNIYALHIVKKYREQYD
ncbi:phosphate ABC transporter permease subunit PstC [Suttonella sp. R2A3]|uniref:phosphate ABC transporter permease subunit PstC n=1 Tax=Suttonella sp. R2A3 TaxID=2908648 RepID=UPI001F230E83|nr:phosphate ABC transporter permease subunit PstC [Suttonella sp. R2A3]UJF24797.1 phosphate ABC transporter permease subunit PstC [Suttonella sp. R2A3]